MSVLCRQVEVSATRLSLVQGSPTDCVASFVETSRMRAPWSALGRSAKRAEKFEIRICVLRWLRDYGVLLLPFMRPVNWNRREVTVFRRGQGVSVRLSGCLIMC